MHPVMAALATSGGEIWPHYDRAGAWIYFEGLTAAGGAEIWRVQPDGTGGGHVGPTGGGPGFHPSPAPDGRRLVFDNSSSLYVMDIATGAATPLGVNGIIPRWSPSGDLIAYRSGDSVWVTKPDGTGSRFVSSLSGRVGLGLDWSPDGKWLVATDYDRLSLIEVATGLTLPLAFTRRGLSEPTWRP